MIDVAAFRPHLGILPDREIARLYAVSHARVGQIRRSLGIAPVLPPGHWSPETRDRVIGIIRRHPKWSAYRVAQVIGVRGTRAILRLQREMREA